MEDHIDPKCIEIGARLSSGSCGVVHAGRMLDPATGQWTEVAIKMMLPRDRPEPCEYTQFTKEVLSTAGLSKPCKHVLKVHGWSETEEGQLCMVMKKYDRHSAGVAR
ncbi:hypothetical protein DUNSADRAFT_6426 [Dunaliella salina]|uniref:Serine-threonine/tyrosine-protein kinase catalytic domain-containing protein n=1 Tax=Dunaliella salina TaxID=3046 RepID=A0ABQ7H6W4_DUNSA|nr:hypothetical protein DUNSADRAFT_6426 [Dunaliella salina]|eukprot:KAF5842576.1 hypothetical protein DUNSADRAFT_6426 [Dunaliella salina]